MNEKYFAVVGDAHGEMCKLLSQLTEWERAHNKKLSFALQVGDFEPIRKTSDLDSLAAPKKFRTLGDFPSFYTGKLKFPWPIYFIGGNHEPYGYLSTLNSGSQIAENVFFLGRAAKNKIEGLNVAGLSGVYSPKYYFSKRPYVEQVGKVSNKRFTYYNCDDLNTLSLEGEADILLMHEWPAGIVKPEDRAFFQEKNIALSSLGNEHTTNLINQVKPSFIFCGHMHMPYKSQIELACGKVVHVKCLSSVTENDGKAFCIMKFKNGEITESFG